ncbi:LysR substrate binding domain [Rhodococcus wratislaviensis]|nr:LysR substrate binding domain [Rhodococcus wratislaviensis]
MVQAGLGVSIVPALALRHFDSKWLVARKLAWPGLERVIYLVQRRDRSLSFATDAFRDWVAEHRPDGSGLDVADVSLASDGTQSAAAPGPQ